MNRDSTWSINLVRVAGVPIRVHLSFLLLLGWVGFSEVASDGHPLREILFVILLFGCVVLHELGHVLVAKAFSISTRDIVLYPIGGIASLTGNPAPRAELLIAVAGPIVNIFLAACLLPFIELYPIFFFEGEQEIASRLFIANVVLAVFNFFPALPMDGGRIVRAGLALIGVRRATVIAAGISQALSLILGIFALIVGNPILVLIAGVVFVNATQERLGERTARVLAGRTVSEVLIPKELVVTFTHGMTVKQALDLALRSFQDLFPVVLGETVIGTVEREDLLHVAADGDGDEYIGSSMKREFPVVTSREELATLLQHFRSENSSAVVVIDQGNFAGLISREKVLDLIFLDGINSSPKRIRDEFHP